VLIYPTSYTVRPSLHGAAKPASMGCVVAAGWSCRSNANTRSQRRSKTRRTSYNWRSRA